MIIDIQTSGTQLKISHFTEDGERNILNIQVPVSQQFVWQKTYPNDRSKDKEWLS